MRLPAITLFTPICYLFFQAFTLAQPENMTLVWSDEFSENGHPDSSKWSYDVGGDGWGNNELQYYTENDLDNARVEDGYLIIETLKETRGSKNYTSARLVTREKGDWLYGRVEVRAKLPGGRGTWPAIWMLPTDWNYGGWPDSGEIDIMEHVGYDMNRIHGTVHTKSFNHTLGTQVGKNIVASGVNQQFHTYSLEWRPERVDIFVDDTHYFSFANDHTGFASWPFDKRFHLLLNIAVGGNWGGVEGVDDSIFPQRMVVDYVRVYAFDDLNAGFVHKVPGSLAAAQYTEASGVSVETSSDVGAGLNLGWIKGGDQVSYTVDVQQSGSYELKLRYASPTGATAIQVLANNQEKLRAANLTSTGGWQNWTTASLGQVNLEAGRQTLTVKFLGSTADDLNLNRLTFYLPVDAVHKFYNPKNGAYFFTGFNQEAQSVLQNLAQWQYKGLAFGVEYGPTQQNQPVYRFYNNRSGSHFYTANADERDNVIANLSQQFSYEGVAFFVEMQPQGLDLISQQLREFYPVYRCYLQGTSSHYFTGDPEEVAYIQQYVAPEVMRYEGIAWFSDRIYLP